mgnify:CR=1 FL=1
MEFKHYSVLLEETIEHLNIRPDGIYVDGTLGGAGHASEVAKRLSEKGRLIGIDQDADAIRAAGERLKPFGDKVTIIRSNYANMKEELHAIGIEHVDGIVLVGSVFDTICQGAEMEKLLSGVPVVLANGKLDLPNAYSVTVDDKYGVSLAVEHLVARGRKNIYYIKDRDTDSAKSKRDGFLEAMRRNELEFADHVLEAGETLASGMETVQALLAQGVVPDGIVCGEDLTER